MSQTCSFTVKNDLPEPARSLRATFAFAPTGIRNPRIVSQPADAPRPIDPTADGYQADFDWNAPVILPCAEVTFEVETDRVPILLVDLHWSTEAHPRPDGSAKEDFQELFDETGALPEEASPCKGSGGGDEDQTKDKDCKAFFEEYDKVTVQPLSRTLLL